MEPDPAAHRNVIDGNPLLTGPIVQARDISGGLHLHQSSGPEARRVVPRQLLPVPAHFIGREQDLRALDALREGRETTAPQIIVVTGPAGVGKTTLVSRWLRDHAGEFPDGQLYVDLRGFGEGEKPDVREVLGRLLRSVGLRELPASLAERAAMWRSMTVGLRFCVMLDNALSAAQVRAMLPSDAGGLVVVTSRQRLSGLVVDGAEFHQLGQLDQRSAVELLSRGLGHERAKREHAAVADLVTLCARLPLAICLVSARLSARPRQRVATVVATLTAGSGSWDTLRVEDTRTMENVLDESYVTLAPDVASLYRRLGSLSVDVFDAGLVAAVCAVDGAEADRLLGDLVEANLLEEVGADRFRFHDLVRSHAAERDHAEGTAADRSETHRRLVDWCLAVATTAEELLAPSHRTLDRTYEFPPDEPAPFHDAHGASAWVSAHRETLLTAVHTAADAGWDATTWQLVDAMWPMFQRLRLYDEWIKCHAAGLAAARRAGSRAGEARMLTSGGIGLRSAGRYDEAAGWFEEALELARADANPRDEAQAWNGLGSSHRGAGRLGEAEDCFRHALALRQSIGYRRGAALSLLRLGELALEQGHHDQAVEHLAGAHDGLQAEQDTYDGARARALLGLALAHTGAHDAGANELHQALAQFEELGSDLWSARTLEMLGDLAQLAGDTRTAREHHHRALSIFSSVSPVDHRRLNRRLGESGSG
ncbi:tetratricopeptide repeat protein [Streptomyces sp. NPDC127098]|uniref:tetratricopeptide repeat protein n=1 Tax=Streptomyces sp. NPDC127098 TaxID=3347137 RepID=UPI003667DD11